MTAARVCCCASSVRAAMSSATLCFTRGDIGIAVPNLKPSGDVRGVSPSAVSAGSGAGPKRAPDRMARCDEPAAPGSASADRVAGLAPGACSPGCRRVDAQLRSTAGTRRVFARGRCRPCAETTPSADWVEARRGSRSAGNEHLRRKRATSGGRSPFPVVARDWPGPIYAPTDAPPPDGMPVAVAVQSPERHARGLPRAAPGSCGAGWCRPPVRAQSRGRRPRTPTGRTPMPLAAAATNRMSVSVPSRAASRRDRRRRGLRRGRRRRSSSHAVCTQTPDTITRGRLLR